MPTEGVERRETPAGVRWKARAWDPAQGRAVSKTFGSLGEAVHWRRQQLGAVAQGKRIALDGIGMRIYVDHVIDGLERGAILNRSGDVYKPSARRGIIQALNTHVLPEVGGSRLRDVHRKDVQRLVDKMKAAGLNASTIRNAINALRVVFRQAIQEDKITASPCQHLAMPAVRGRRDRIVGADQAAALIAALPTTWDRGVWGTAFYAGLRRGELRGLERGDVDLDAGELYVRRSIDDQEGEIDVKSFSGRRTVVIPRLLRPLLAEQLSETRGPLMFPGQRAGGPFTTGAPQRRADPAWTKDGLERLTLHEARHTYASILIQAGCNPQTLSKMMGHSSITITFDRYGHLMPGALSEALCLVDAYLEGAS